MKTIIQRVSSASVSVDNNIVGQIQCGIVALCGFGKADSEAVLSVMLEKIANMRIFPDERGRMHHSLIETKGALLLIPQFTLYADTTKGRRPEFFSAKAPQQATLLFDELCKKAEGLLPGRIQCGEFAAHMMLTLCNDGPVTIPIEIDA